MLKKFPSDKINVTKNAHPSRAPTHHSFTFNSRLLYELKFYILSFIFCSTESMNSLTLKRHNKMNKNKNKINRKDTRLLIFKLQLEV